MEKVQTKINQLLEEDHQVSIEYDDSDQDNVTCTRYANIQGVLKSTCGGTHVSSLKVIKQLII